MQSNSATAPLLALGIISGPDFTERRESIRQSWLAHVPPGIVAKFVVRAGEDEVQCNGTKAAPPPRRSSATVQQLASDFNASDVLLLDSVCKNERRDRGAVLGIYSWLQHAVTTYRTAKFIGKTDDDVWIHLDALRLLLMQVRSHGIRHALLGPLMFTSYVAVDGDRDFTSGFGYNCHEAVQYFRQRVVPYLAPNESSRGQHSAGPTTFAAGYLTVASKPLISSLVASQGLADRMQHELRSNSHAFGLEDKWLGDAMQQHAYERVHDLHLVDTRGSDLNVDSYGVHALATTMIWHNKVKDAKRLLSLDDFSRRHSCWRGIVEDPTLMPTLSCSATEQHARNFLVGRTGGACSPKHTAWCVFRWNWTDTRPHGCMQRHFSLNWSVPGLRTWTPCQAVKWTAKCVLDENYTTPYE